MATGGVAKDFTADTILLSIKCERGSGSRLELVEVACYNINRTILDVQANVLKEQGAVVISNAVFTTSEEVEKGDPSKVHTGVI